MSYDPKDPAQNWLSDYLRAVADKYGLRDWSLQVSWDAPEGKHGSDSTATMEVVYGRRLGILRVGDFFWQQAAKEQRVTITHELTHCHLGNAQTWAEQRLKPCAWDAFVLMLEGGVDSISEGIAPFLPLPPKLKLKPTKLKLKPKK